MSAAVRQPAVTAASTAAPLRLVPGGLAGRRIRGERPATTAAGASVAPATTRKVMPLTVYVAVLSLMMISAMLASLVIHTVLTQGAFEMQQVQKEMKSLRDQHEDLTQKVAAAESPVAIEQRARDMGMVPAASPVFLRLADKSVLGDPVAAKR